jgi:hypothetical protein
MSATICGILTLKNRTSSPLARLFIECACDIAKPLAKRTPYTLAETIAKVQKATMIHEEGRTARPPRVLTDER